MEYLRVIKAMFSVPVVSVNASNYYRSMYAFTVTLLSLSGVFLIMSVIINFIALFLWYRRKKNKGCKSMFV